MSRNVHPDFHQPHLEHIYNELHLKKNRPDLAFREASRELQLVRHRQATGQQPAYARESQPADLTPEQELAYRLEMADLAVVTGKSHMMRQGNLSQAIPQMIGLTRLINEEYPIAADEVEAIARGQAWEHAYDESIHAHFKAVRELFSFVSILTQVFPTKELQKVQHGLWQLLFLEQSFQTTGEKIDHRRQSHDVLLARMEHLPLEGTLETRDLENFLNSWSEDANEVVAVTSSFAARAVAGGKWQVAFRALQETGGKILKTLPTDLEHSLQLAGLAIRNFAKYHVRQQRIQSWAQQYAQQPRTYDFSEIEAIAKSWQHVGMGNYTAVTLQK